MFRFNLWARPFLHPAAAAPGMEASPYLQAHLGTSGGMLALGSTAEANRSGLHLSPQGSTPEKEKEHSTPFSGAFPMFRPGDPIPPALYSPLHQQFLRAQLDLAASHAAARDEHHPHPLSVNTHPSAFVPAKRPKISEIGDGDEIPIKRRMREEDDKVRSPGMTSDKYSGSPSPHSIHSRGSSSPDQAALDMRMDLNRRSNMGSSSPHITMVDGDILCPICRSRVPKEEMDVHFTSELRELQRLVADVFVQRRHPGSSSYDNPTNLPSKSRYETFLRIRENREVRLGKLRGLRRRRQGEDGLYMINGQTDLNTSDEREDETIDVLSCDEQSPADRLNTSSPHATEDESNKDLSKCFVCRTPFTKCSPVTSIKCWHVHCDKCWKNNQNENNTESLCPQCKIPIIPDDLRPIYI